MKTITSALTALMLLSAGVAFAQPGSLDSSFNKDGKIKSTLLGNVSSIAIQPDGKILIEDGFSVIRLRQNGTIDKSFGIDGQASTSFEGLNQGYLLALQADGKIIVAGYSIDNSDIYYISVARFNKNGIPDSSFGINGQVKTDANYYTPNDITTTQDGKILVAADNFDVFYSDILILEYNADGSFYDQFGYSGGPYTRNFVNALAIQSTGKIVVTGSTSNDSSGAIFTLLRFNENGLPDNSFGTEGKALLNFATGDALVLQSNDKIIALAGDSILRFSKNGTPDSSFGINGKALKVFGSSVAIQTDNKIIIAGTLNNDFALARYKTNGKPDETFGVKGIVTTDFGNNDNANSVAIQTDGKIILAGASVTMSHRGKCVIARYNGDAVLFNNITDDISSKIISQNLSAVLRIYPNPVQSILNIEFNTKGTVQKRISIYDVNGKLLLTKSAAGNAALNVRQLMAGTYLVKITDENGKELYSGKVIKQ